LQDNAELPADGAQIKPGKVLSVEEDGSRLRRFETQQQAEQCRFPRTGGALPP